MVHNNQVVSPASERVVFAIDVNGRPATTTWSIRVVTAFAEYVRREDTWSQTRYGVW